MERPEDRDQSSVQGPLDDEDSFIKWHLDPSHKTPTDGLESGEEISKNLALWRSDGRIMAIGRFLCVRSG